MASYDHIELTEEETAWAMIDAKQKKERVVELKTYEDRIRASKAISTKEWRFTDVSAFMINRMADVFPDFAIDNDNEFVYLAMCYYFSSDLALGKFNPAKGILMCGNVGTGKTLLMKLFSRNPRQCFNIESAKNISETYQTDGVAALNYYCQPHKNPMNDAEMFYQPVAGLCIDDLGAEDVKKNYGNNSNVIGDIIESRYSKGFTGPLLHGTTNLTAVQLAEYYGPRVTSRMREVFNFIELPGTDRRK